MNFNQIKNTSNLNKILINIYSGVTNFWATELKLKRRPTIS